jgi:hypothetical protein
VGECEDISGVSKIHRANIIRDCFQHVAWEGAAISLLIPRLLEISVARCIFEI